MPSLLERVRFMGGDGGAGQEPEKIPDDLGELLDPDPAPSASLRDKPRNAPKIGPRPTGKVARNGGKFVSRAQAQKDLADELNMWLKVLAGAWSLSDEECAGALNETSAVIAADMAKLGARSDWVMEKFSTTSLLGDIAQFALHSKPLITAMWKHHGPGAQARRAEEEETYESIPVVDPNAYGPWRPPIG